MNVKHFGATICLFASAAMSSDADAGTVSVRCDLNPSTALSSALNSSPAGTTFAITGICQSTNVPLGLFIITITNETGDPSSSLIPTDGIQGQLTITGPQWVNINGITMEGTSVDSGTTSNIAVAFGATVLIQNAQIINGQRTGLTADRSANVRILNTTISGNGIANVPGENDGIRITASSLDLGQGNANGTINFAQQVTVSGNAGNGISVLGGSHLTMGGGVVQGNAGDQILLIGGSTAGLFGTQVTQAAAPNTSRGFAIEEIGTSILGLAKGAIVSGGTVAGGVYLGSTSSLYMNGSTISNATVGFASVQATGGSNVILSGGNTIANTSANGVAANVDHSASLQQLAEAGLLPEILAASSNGSVGGENITGTGIVLTQGTMDLGTGATNPSTWNGSVFIQGNSSLRMSGGITITGQVQLKQGSNAAFNTFNGGSNVVNGGVSCPTNGGLADARVAGATAVIPNVTVGTNPVITTPPTCLAF